MAGKFSLDATIRAVDRFSRPIAKMSSGVDRFTRRTERGFARLKRSAKDFKNALGPIGAIAAKAAVAGAALATAAGAAAAAVIKPSMDVEDALAKVSTVVTPAMGSVQDALAKTKAAAIDWSKNHTQSIEEFLDANYNMASAGLNSEQAIAGTTAALRLATATMGEADVAGNLLATVYNNLGDKSANAEKEMGRLGDVLAKTQALFQIKDLSQLNESLKMGAPSAIQFGVSVEQLSTAVGALNTAGLQGSAAGTAFSASMRQMGKASKDLGFAVAKTASGGVDYIGTLTNIEKKFGSFEKMTDKQKAAFQKSFGDEGVRAIALTLGKTDELAASLDKVTNSTGAAEEAQKKIEGTTSKKLQIRWNNLKATAVNLGDSLMPAIEPLMGLFERISESVGKWVEENKELIGGGFKSFIEKVVPVIEKIASAFGGAFLETVESSAKALGQFFDSGDSKTGDQWVKTFQSLATTLGKVAGFALMAAGIFAGLSTGLVLVANTIVNAVIGAFDGFVEFVGKRLFAVLDWFADLGAKFRQEGISLGDKAVDIGKHIIKGLVRGIKGLATLPLDALKEIGGTALKALKESLGEKSPSKPAGDMGAFVTKGLGLGMLRELPAVEAASRKLADMALPDIAKAAAIDPIVVPVRFVLEPFSMPAFGDHHGPRVEPQAQGLHGAMLDELISMQSTQHTETNRLIIEDQTGRARLDKPARNGDRIQVQRSGGL